MPNLPTDYIPKGSYCYNKNQSCPYWKHIKTIKYYEGDCPYFSKCQSNTECETSPKTMCKVEIVRCEYMDYTDYDEDTLLWDMVKECGIKDNLEEE